MIRTRLPVKTPWQDQPLTVFAFLTSNEWELAARYINDADNDGDLLDANEYYLGDYSSGADAQAGATSGGSDIDGDGDIEYTTDVANRNRTDTLVAKSKSYNALGLCE